MNHSSLSLPSSSIQLPRNLRFTAILAGQKSNFRVFASMSIQALEKASAMSFLDSKESGILFYFFCQCQMAIATAITLPLITVKHRSLSSPPLSHSSSSAAGDKLDLLRSYGDIECLYDLSQELCMKEKLKVVGRASIGIDNVDLQAVMELGCLVMNAPMMNTIVAAEHGIALLTSMTRNVAQPDASIKARKWLRTKYVGVSLVGKTLAIMGFVELSQFLSNAELELIGREKEKLLLEYFKNVYAKVMKAKDI
ncbi:D-3-phosphoglycerate dehydrogenase [Perilla frutescens var. hirtella]|uniref:D-3-phosphoglycerate dehydrogenase n=1 Tax=Perilla frutescens var. hirtella TaxID=608512 RepID=A0AAD4IPD4_PERFH|nr:D-3-phosphoglycerate dehydrogenase [Perilla frutescens var. hirtella]